MALVTESICDKFPYVIFDPKNLRKHPPQVIQCVRELVDVPQPTDPSRYGRKYNIALKRRITLLRPEQIKRIESIISPCQPLGGPIDVAKIPATLFKTVEEYIYLCDPRHILEEKKMNQQPPAPKQSKLQLPAYRKYEQVPHSLCEKTFSPGPMHEP